MKFTFLALGLLATNAFSPSTAMPLEARDPAEQNANTSGDGKQVLINSENDFCLFLPPEPGLEVAPYETEGVPFCQSANEVPGAQQFPEGKLLFLTNTYV